MIYKGVKILEDDNLRSYISTYLLLDNDNWEQHLDTDKGFQRAIKLHKLKEKSFIVIFNISIYIVFYLMIMIVKA